MNAKHQLYLATALYFIGLLLFETAQQQYYIISFDLQGNRAISYWGLLQNHALLWLVWLLLVLPLVLYARKHPVRKLSMALLVQYGWRILVTLSWTLATVSLIKLWSSGQPIQSFWEFFSFYTFQKAALFVNAYLGIVVFMTLRQSLQLLDAKVVELSELSDQYRSLAKDYQQKQLGDETPLLQIKIGNKVKNILLSEVFWVQSDDYCVKIHTKHKAYHLRKSMKALEQELAPRGFIRIHRNSIVNKTAIDTLMFQAKPQVKLKNGQKLPIALSRIPKIKACLQIA